MSIDDPKKLGEALDKLTDKQFKEYQEWFKRDTYRIDSLGYYLSDRFDKMKPGDCRRTFILNIVSKFKLENQFGYKRNRGKIR